MDRRLISLFVGAVCASCALTLVTGTSLNTPLYTVRMEQASSRMNFLPYAVNTFTYTTEGGYTLDYGVTGCCTTVRPFATYNSCEPDTCDETCPVTCWSTCDDPTCPSTCADTCPYTCDDYTCSSTCEETCPNTCDTCWNTCWYTCHTCKVCPPTEGPQC